MNRTPLALAFALGVLLPSAACVADTGNKLPADAQAVLDKAEEIELYSLDPAENADAEKPKEQFHGWRVLGKTTVTKGDKKDVVEALGKGIKGSDGSVAACFNPRHGIRATHDKKTVELVICFECLSMQVFEGGEKTASVLTTATPQKTLDKVLTAAKVPLPGQADKK